MITTGFITTQKIEGSVHPGCFQDVTLEEFYMENVSFEYPRDAFNISKAINTSRIHINHTTEKNTYMNQFFEGLSKNVHVKHLTLDHVYIDTNMVHELMKLMPQLTSFRIDLVNITEEQKLLVALLIKKNDPIR